MEPITIVMALAAVIGTKTLENITQVVWDKSAKLLESLKQESPDTARAIEQAPEQPLDYGQAVLEMQEAAENPDVAQRMQELATAAEADPNPKLAEILQEIAEELKSQKSSMPKLEKLADKIGQVAIEGGTGTIQNQTF